MLNLLEYQTVEGTSPFSTWFNELNAEAAAKVTQALVRMGQGNLSNVEPVGSGVSEYKINFGPGYRIYFGRDGNRLVILLLGGSKKRQQRDIEQAKSYWSDYKLRRRGSVQ